MPITEYDVEVRADCVTLPGSLTVPTPCRGTVIFAHGSGSSRLSPRNRAVATSLVDRGCATLLFDLLTPAEADNRQNVFDIQLLGSRVVDATSWVRHEADLPAAPIGYFGASTGSAAALVAASRLGTDVAAIVSRGGRPDLAGDDLPRVASPTLLIVGSRDYEVLALNEQAARSLRCEHVLEIVEGATHLFEEPGTLERAAELAGDWFVDHFGG